MTRTDSRNLNKLRLGEFIRSRRERLSPAELGVTPIGRRRTPGLRRDEVAQLSGISIAYYTWMEQGRDLNVSSDVLQALARTLRLTRAERRYLFALAGIAISDPPDDCLQMHPTLTHLLRGGETPCSLEYDCWFNIIGATPPACSVFGLEAGADQNLLNVVFGDPRQRGRWFEWEREARLLAGMFRQSLATWPDDLEGVARLQQLRALPDFERIWQDDEVHERPSPVDYFRSEPWRLRHPLGTLSFHRIAMVVPTGRNRELALYSPADGVTAEGLRRLSLQHDRPERTREESWPAA
jgi:transcriptional regulator with XRE-family HTH domain